eukprot:74348-Pyramimonas_sp.AAC.2
MDGMCAAIRGEESSWTVDWSYDENEDVWWCAFYADEGDQPTWATSSWDWSNNDAGWNTTPDQWGQATAVTWTPDLTTYATDDDSNLDEQANVAEILAAEANRTLSEARGAVAEARKNRGSFRSRALARTARRASTK